MSEPLTVVTVIGILANFIGRQLLVEPLRSGRVVLLPVVPTVIGDVDLGGCRHVRPAGLLCLLADWLPELAQGCAIPGLPCNPTQITVEREGVGASH